MKGGITTLVKTAHLAEAFRMNYEIHHGGNSLNNVANLHVIMAIRNTEFCEVLLPENDWVTSGEVVLSTDGDLPVGEKVTAGTTLTIGARSLVLLREL